MILMADHIVSVNRQTIYLSTSDASHPGSHPPSTRYFVGFVSSTGSIAYSVVVPSVIHYSPANDSIAAAMPFDPRRNREEVVLVVVVVEESIHLSTAKLR